MEWLSIFYLKRHRSFFIPFFFLENETTTEAPQFGHWKIWHYYWPKQTMLAVLNKGTLLHSINCYKSAAKKGYSAKVGDSVAFGHFIQGPLWLITVIRFNFFKCELGWNIYKKMKKFRKETKQTLYLNLRIYYYLHFNIHSSAFIPLLCPAVSNLFSVINRKSLFFWRAWSCNGL